MGFLVIIPLVNGNKKLWKDPPCVMGKLTISMASRNSYVTNYQRIRFKIAIEAMAIEIETFPINSMVIFHSFVLTFTSHRNSELSH